MAEYHLAQLNIAHAKTPIDAPEMDDFNALLDPVNALADRSPGFVWRLLDESGSATSIRAFDDDWMIVNMSVWESVDALWDFVYDSGHLDVMRRRREWFRRFDGAYMVLWWVPAGHVPTVEEAKRRLELIDRLGPTPDAFTFKVRFDPPEPGAASEPALDEREGCPA